MHTLTIPPALRTLHPISALPATYLTHGVPLPIPRGALSELVDAAMSVYKNPGSCEVVRDAALDLVHAALEAGAASRDQRRASEVSSTGSWDECGEPIRAPRPFEDSPSVRPVPIQDSQPTQSEPTDKAQSTVRTHPTEHPQPALQPEPAKRCETPAPDLSAPFRWTINIPGDNADGDRDSPLSPVSLPPTPIMSPALAPPIDRAGATNAVVGPRAMLVRIHADEQHHDVLNQPEQRSHSPDVSAPPLAQRFPLPPPRSRHRLLPEPTPAQWLAPAKHATGWPLALEDAREAGSESAPSVAPAVNTAAASQPAPESQPDSEPQLSASKPLPAPVSSRTPRTLRTFGPAPAQPRAQPFPLQPVYPPSPRPIQSPPPHPHQAQAEEHLTTPQPKYPVRALPVRPAEYMRPLQPVPYVQTPYPPQHIHPLQAPPPYLAHADLRHPVETMNLPRPTPTPMHTPLVTHLAESETRRPTPPVAARPAPFFPPGLGFPEPASPRLGSAGSPSGPFEPCAAEVLDPRTMTEEELETEALQTAAIGRHSGEYQYNEHGQNNQSGEYSQNNQYSLAPDHEAADDADNERANGLSITGGLFAFVPPPSPLRAPTPLMQYADPTPRRASVSPVFNSASAVSPIPIPGAHPSQESVRTHTTRATFGSLLPPAVDSVPGQEEGEASDSDKENEVPPSSSAMSSHTLPSRISAVPSLPSLTMSAPSATIATPLSTPSASRASSPSPVPRLSTATATGPSTAALGDTILQRLHDVQKRIDDLHARFDDAIADLAERLDEHEAAVFKAGFSRGVSSERAAVGMLERRLDELVAMLRDGLREKKNENVDKDEGSAQQEDEGYFDDAEEEHPPGEVLEVLEVLDELSDQTERSFEFPRAHGRIRRHRYPS